MTEKEIVDALLRLAEILTAWPIILFFVFLLFRKEIREFMPEVKERLTKATFGEISIELSEKIKEEVKKESGNALPEVIEAGMQLYKDKPEQFADFVREQVKKLSEFQTVTPAPSSAEISLVGHSILWVDDNPMNNVYESSILKRFGASLVTARSTDEALAFLNQTKFDIIISDVHRVEDGQINPNAGYELLEKVSRMSRKCPLVFCTSNAASLNKNRSGQAVGAADIPSELINLVVRALSDGERR